MPPPLSLSSPLLSTRTPLLLVFLLGGLGLGLGTGGLGLEAEGEQVAVHAVCEV